MIISQKAQGGIPLTVKKERVKDISWESAQIRYIIHNVPFHIYEAYSNEQVYRSDVTAKLLLLKDLMESNEIPSEIDFKQAMDIK